MSSEGVNLVEGTNPESPVLLMRTDEKNPTDIEQSSSSFASPNSMEKNSRLSYISRKYDLDGDGKLDPAEKALRDMDDGTGLNKVAVYNHIQELLSTQKALYSTKRILIIVSIFSILLLVAIFGLSFAVAELTDDTDIDAEGQLVATSTPDNVVVAEGEKPVVATIAEGHVIHIDSLDDDPYGIAQDKGSIFFPEGSISTATEDPYECSFQDYAPNAVLVGKINHCGTIYHAAQAGQAISFLSSRETDLAPGQSLSTLTLEPAKHWRDPMRETPSGESIAAFGFYKHTMHLIQGTVGFTQECRLFLFIEDSTTDWCPYYEIKGCVVPECIANPPSLINTGGSQPTFPQP